MLYTIKLMSFRNDEILMIDLCMRMCGLSMNQAAECVDHMPSILIRNADENKVEEFKKAFEEANAVLQIISADEEAALEPDEVLSELNQGDLQSNFEQSMPTADYVDNTSSYDDFGIDQSNEEFQSNQNDDYDNSQEYAEYDNSQEYTDYTQNNYDNNQEYSSNNEYSSDQVQYSQENVAEYYEGNQTDVQEEQQQSVVQIVSEQSDEKNIAEEKEDTDYKIYESCPRCGSTFVSVKKSNGLFGNKVKYVCDACKHKF